MKRAADTLIVPLLVLLVTLVVTVTAVKITGDRAQEAQAKFEAQRTQMREAQARVQKSGVERDLIVRYLPDYRRLDALGFVGDEQRINWLDALRYANQKGALFGINYEIAARKTYARAAALNPGAINVMQSLMKVRFQMLHEEDLSNFLANLAAQNAGVFIINQCALRRSGPTQTERYLPNITAECDLAWITAQAPPLPEVRQ